MRALGLGILLVLAGAGTANGETADFDGMPLGQAPSGWTCGVTGAGTRSWKVEEDAQAHSPPHVPGAGGQGGARHAVATACRSTATGETLPPVGICQLRPKRTTNRSCSCCSTAGRCFNLIVQRRAVWHVDRGWQGNQPVTMARRMTFCAAACVTVAARVP